jgi:hypothetical protein
MLLVLAKSPLRRALRARLRQTNTPYRLGKPTGDDLFERALGRTAVVYAPTSSALRGVLDPAPVPERMRAVIRAANAPGCGPVVAVVPKGDGYESELDVLRRSGKPYLVIQTPPLLEEVSEELARDGIESVWIPRTGSVEVAAAVEVAASVLAASESDWQGRTETVAGTELGLPDLFEHAADLTGRAIRVHSLWPPLHRLVSPALRWLSGKESNAVRMATTLAARDAA